MNTSTRAAERLARWLLDVESPEGEPEPGELVAAAEHACGKLRKGTVGYLGAAGFDALMKRAARRAADSFEWLDGIRIDANAGTDDCLAGLDEAVRERDAGEARAALTELLTNFVWLLFTFLGKDLGMRLLTNVWPEATLETTEAATTEG